jgi:chromosome segregation ATPase
MVKSLNDETVLNLQAQIADLSKSIQNISGEVKEVKDSYNEFGKRVDAVEQDTAFRKSGDLGEIVQEPEMVQKSVWGGRFLTNADLFK